MEYPALKTFAALSSAFTLNTPSLVYQPNRNLLTLNKIQ